MTTAGSGVVTLPERTAMFVRLAALAEGPHVARALHPEVVDALAGREVTAPELLAGVVAAVDRYAKPFPETYRAVVSGAVPGYIGAICPDPHVASAAKALHEAGQVRATAAHVSIERAL